MSGSFWRLTPLLSVLLFAGCSDSGTEDVRQWMEQTRAQSRVSVKPLPEPKKFTPFSYEVNGREEPFNTGRLATAERSTKGNVRPNLDRPRELLESHPLDTMHMVGTLAKPGLTYALIRVDKTIYQVKVGSYVGQNLGLVTNITESEVSLKETVQDAAGEWTEREARLELQETQK